MKLTLVTFLSFAALCSGQQAGTNTEESHVPLSMEDCSSGSCSTISSSITIDSNWRWAHHVDDYVNCYTGNEWDQTFCPDSATCTANCAIDGVDQAQYGSTYGITSTGSELSLKFITEGTYSTNIGSRVYLLESETAYKMFYLKNREFVITVDHSQVPCGLNGALYFVEMEQDGGMASYPSNEAGAKFGTGYCDAQCPHDMKFIGGEANCDEWVPSETDPNSGAGHWGVCCYEMDIFEANSMAQSFTPHDCSVPGYHPCEGTECGDNPDDRYNGVCDKDGCDFASYRNGQLDFYGPGNTVDSSQPLTLVTQFITSDGTDTGDLTEVRRVYIQNGQVIQNVPVMFDGVPAHDSVTDDYCTDIKNYFGDVQDFEMKGGMKAMGDSLDRGHVLVMSLWDDHLAHMHWLDSTYPETSTDPGAARGPCPTSGGDPVDVEAMYPDATVKFSDIKLQPIQTYN